jgi:predicted dehydrogenase
MKKKIRWGVLGVAKIATSKVIPAMQKSELIEVVAIASRSLDKAQKAAQALAIPRAYGSYEALLADPDVDAVYNPLPNHLHVPFSKLAAAAKKHVLCEKPIALSAAEARELVVARDRHGVLIQEAFMVRTHPQWLAARALVREGRIGALRVVQSAFSYFNDDPANVRNLADIGGGGIYDIGCYPITTSRFLFDEEPTRVLALVERDPAFGTDRLATALLEFPSGQALFVCSTQLVLYQRTQILGTRGRIEIEVPYNAPADRPCRIFVDDGRDTLGSGIETLAFDTLDQYTLETEAFSRAILEGKPAPIPLEDAVCNMAVIDALFRSATSGRWETPNSS